MPKNPLEVTMEVTMEANKNLVRKYVEYFNAGDLNGLRSVCAPDAVIHGVLGWGKLEMVLPIWKQLADSLRMQLTVEDMIAEGDVVAVRYKETGTALKPFFDKPATGKSYEVVAMECSSCAPARSSGAGARVTRRHRRSSSAGTRRPARAT